MALIPLNQQFHTVSHDVDTTERGSELTNSRRASFTMQDIGNTIGNSESSVYVKADGTPQENGAALLAAYAKAAAKSSNTTNIYSATGTSFDDDGDGDYAVYGIDMASLPDNIIEDSNYIVDYGTTPAQTLVWRINSASSSGRVRFEITDIEGNFLENLNIDLTQLPIKAGAATLSTLIVGPGQYDLPSELRTGQDAVSIVSLTGERDVYITGGDIIVSTESNAKGRIFSGLDLSDGPYNGKNFFIEDGLYDVTFKNIKAMKYWSFCNEGGGGNMSGTFIDCIAGMESFAAYGHASGIFINCQADGSSFAAGGITSGYFDGCKVSDTPWENNYGVSYRSDLFNGSEQCGGVFINCVSNRSSFGHGSDNVIGHFINCRAYGNDCFGSESDKNSGTFINCHAFIDTSEPFFRRGSCFGSNNTSTVAADTEDSKYYYCTARGGSNFGTNSDVAKTAYGTYIGCISEGIGLSGTNKSFGKEIKGNILNCVIEKNNNSGDGTFATVGTGKIRNSIDGDFNIITLN